jgi:hypothetical protein
MGTESVQIFALVSTQITYGYRFMVQEKVKFFILNQKLKPMMIFLRGLKLNIETHEQLRSSVSNLE